MKCGILFSGKNEKNIINLSSAELAQRVVKVKGKNLFPKKKFGPLGANSFWSEQPSFFFI